ncbi:type VI secretion protein [Pseudomonas sp. Leaf127]|uniref:type VI secretion system lipoprotein TssJ n=1 Tax=Pseudomonas sp. Leaf127 TaxID=1736267 RepID=UPI000702DD1E|nr:type VI secretion system lipoprotein TssJ [Pseudomonas sp. Leaf127]KQQ49350.1 type VI secretion protein [Pseudomonas sp. Leaf127]
MLRIFAPLIALALLLGGCSSKPGEPPALAPVEAAEDGAITLYLQAAAGLNPGASGQPAPVRVRIFELKNSAAFSRADYFALAERAGDALGADLIDQDEVLVRPGESRRVTRTLNPATRHIGLVVGYREIDRALWRLVLPVAPRQDPPYRIELDAQAIRSAPVTLPAH